MYLSNTLNGNNLISSSYDATPFPFESNHTCSKQYESETNIINCPPQPFSFFQFPYSPFEDNNNNNNQFFLQQHHGSNFQSLVPETTSTIPTTHPLPLVNNDTDADHASVSMNHPPPPAEGQQRKNKIKGQIQATTRKRTSKRDRHSKIKTARGLRDRRMRLSLEVAQRFFGLQDMLGFEKASKTVEWLLNKSKLEIKELAKTNKNNLTPPISNTASSTSECEEGVSSLDEVMEERDSSTVVVVKVKKIKRSKIINNKVSRKSAFTPISREKARERARERTREKIMRKNAVADESNSKQCNDDAKNNNINNLLWNLFNTGVEEESEAAAGTTTTHQSTTHVKNPSSFEEQRSQAKEYSGTTVVEDDNSLFIMSKWSPTMMFNSFNNSGLIPQDHQFAQFQSLEKPWEAYNNRF